MITKDGLNWQFNAWKEKKNVQKFSFDSEQISRSSLYLFINNHHFPLIVPWQYSETRSQIKILQLLEMSKKVVIGLKENQTVSVACDSWAFQKLYSLSRTAKKKKKNFILLIMKYSWMTLFLFLSLFESDEAAREKQRRRMRVSEKNELLAKVACEQTNENCARVLEVC